MAERSRFHNGSKIAALNYKQKNNNKEGGQFLYYNVAFQRYMNDYV